MEMKHGCTLPAARRAENHREEGVERISARSVSANTSTNRRHAERETGYFMFFELVRVARLNKNCSTIQSPLHDVSLA